MSTPQDEARKEDMLGDDRPQGTGAGSNEEANDDPTNVTDPVQVDTEIATGQVNSTADTSADPSMAPGANRDTGLEKSPVHQEDDADQEDAEMGGVEDAPKAESSEKQGETQSTAVAVNGTEPQQQTKASIEALAKSHLIKMSPFVANFG